MAPETKYAHVGEINIAYQTVGEGPIDLVLVPGWVSNIEVFWDDPRVARFFQKLSTFSRLILFDKRGTGLSDRITQAATLEERMVNLEQDLKDYQELLEVFVQALIKRGWSTRAELEQRWKQLHEKHSWAGGVIVAKAWTDPEFKQALLSTGREALREMGIHQGKVGKLVVVENTDKVHNVIVCTLCSCYPYDILGDTPWWYKHESYRTRIVQNPRTLIKEMFGLEVPPNKEVQVHDSTSDVRYFVLPQRPKGTDGMCQEDLAKLVTVDSLLGAGLALEPSKLQEVQRSGAVPESPRVRPD